MIQPTSEGAAFSQYIGKKDQCGYKKTNDKKYCKSKICFEHDKEGHPVSHCSLGNKKDAKKNKSDDNKSRAG